MIFLGIWWEFGKAFPACVPSFLFSPMGSWRGKRHIINLKLLPACSALQLPPQFSLLWKGLLGRRPRCKAFPVLSSICTISIPVPSWAIILKFQKIPHQEKVGDLSSILRLGLSLRIRKVTMSLRSHSWGSPWWYSGWEPACQCRGRGFAPWSGRIPHAVEQLGPWATTTEPARLEPVLRNERPRQWEARALRWRVAPACHN